MILINNHELNLYICLNPQKTGHGHGLTELKGYICRNKDEILIAFDVLTEQIGHNNVVLKHYDENSGNNLYFYDIL